MTRRRIKTFEVNVWYNNNC